MITAQRGLTFQAIRLRSKLYGKNEILSQQAFSGRQLFFSQFLTLINGILFAAGVISLLIGNFLDSLFIFAVIFINAIFGFIQEYRANKSLEKLQHYTAPTARVIREGKEEKILAAHLVPGDIVILGEGCKVPADGKLTETHHLEIDESVLTGESLPVIKSQGENVYLGSLVTGGNGIFAVVTIGSKTEFGQITHTLTTIQTRETPLGRSLDHLGKFLSLSALTAGLLIIPIGLTHGRPLLPLILVAASIGIAAIPEGLPAVLTIALALGTRRMAKRGAIVRKMPVIETLGAVQYILVDKTGTLTQNIMRVKNFWVESKTSMRLLLEACVLGNTASLIQKGNGKQFEIAGDRTDGALLLWAKEHMQHPLSEDGRVQDEYVFDANSKTITTVWKHGLKMQVFVRGAPEAILAKSNLNETKRIEAAAQFEAMAKEGLRVIAFGCKMDRQLHHGSRNALERDLTFLGFLGLSDPPRPEVKEAVQKARRAGIRVIMVTGDNELTALSLARETELIDDNEDVMTGEQLKRLSDEALSEILTKTSVFARTRPEEKLRLVTLLQKKGFVVGVTGDGINDALALEQADAGIAMGEGGTDVAKEASDIVLVDDNFATLVKAIEEGRVIYKNIVNAIVYLLSGNLAELSLVFFAVVFRLPFPLLPTQILWINLITDSLPALALAAGSRDTSVLKKKPRDPKMPILNIKRIVQISLIGFSLSIFLVILFSYLLRTNSEAHARTVIFNLLIYFHLLIVMAIGRHSLKRGNIFLVLTVFIIILLQLMINGLPVFQTLFYLR